MGVAVIAYVGLGSNLGRRLQQLKAAIARLHASNGIRVTSVSNVYQSGALLNASSETAQPDYLNAVVRIRTSLPSRWLLLRLLQIEKDFGRTRHRRWAPRTLDLDLLLYGQQRIQRPDLRVPHPELHKRAFVLYPLRDIAADLMVPGRGPLSRLLQKCDSRTLLDCKRIT